ncbi:hypothetical protein F0562_006026 [Nyssa sinensis]|uniref:Uncharacterized protein n=1 Tax=Nyssa sinensis TaxID=561372 RepID=A0A5J5API7_9ASTE|nr:hypothetical protein F0562_006026 [Nyssa sinensis]
MWATTSAYIVHDFEKAMIGIRRIDAKCIPVPEGHTSYLMLQAHGATNTRNISNIGIAGAIGSIGATRTNGVTTLFGTIRPTRVATLEPRGMPIIRNYFNGVLVDQKGLVSFQEANTQRVATGVAIRGRDDVAAVVDGFCDAFGWPQILQFKERNQQQQKCSGSKKRSSGSGSSGGRRGNHVGPYVVQSGILEDFLYG